MRTSTTYILLAGLAALSHSSFLPAALGDFVSEAEPTAFADTIFDTSLEFNSREAPVQGVQNPWTALPTRALSQASRIPQVQVPMMVDDLVVAPVPTQPPETQRRIAEAFGLDLSPVEEAELTETIQAKAGRVDKRVWSYGLSYAAGLSHEGSQLQDAV